MKKHILAVDLGTYCDNALMENAIHKLIQEYQVIYLTDRNHTVPEGCIYEPFTTPDFFIKDPKLKIADTQENIWLWSARHPRKSVEAIQWATSIYEQISSIYRKYEIHAVVMLYPALAMTWFLLNYPAPVYVLYYAPGFLNKTIPWIFDSKMKSREFELYNTDEDTNMKSGYTMLNRLCIASRRLPCERQLVHMILKQLNHVLCWDKHVTPKITPALEGLRTHYVGSLYNYNTIKDVELEQSTVFVSFGSYGNAKVLIPIVEALMAALDEYCEANNGVSVIFHNGNYNSKHVKSVKGFIPYHEIVPKCRLVIFTGSACLQNICLFYAKPMLFVPILVEQFFWAKNYAHMTGVDYIDSTKNVLDKIKQACEITPKCKRYLKKVSDSMKTYNSSDRISSLISRAIS